ncbi:hypothetical protein PRIPAC_93307 [Pristionchus pacificus]|uniref:Uncharacterized protein n=1 Tax=Pristionchus pacificus TaxID=54126 RepID=A0A2A6CHI0_PRIPA|nr:hypothetical protein PRIPAC_93307 [Pristionchus pacificus]|eukprot:PDM77523.1 hypothetical protein PRIPAC_34390 [Pristionchus pacificus]
MAVRVSALHSGYSRMSEERFGWCSEDWGETRPFIGAEEGVSAHTPRALVMREERRESVERRESRQTAKVGQSLAIISGNNRIVDTAVHFSILTVNAIIVKEENGVICLHEQITMSIEDKVGRSEVDGLVGGLEWDIFTIMGWPWARAELVAITPERSLKDIKK